MSLVEDHVVPRLALEDVGIAASEGVRSDTDVEVRLVGPPLTKFLSTFSGTVICEDFEARKKLLELHFPVQENTGRHDDEMRAPDAPVAGKVSEEGDGLNRLPVEESDGGQ